MTDVTGIGSTLTASFLASFVEVVEAFTIVLAVGITSSWRAALSGTALALITLALLVAIFGPLLALVPLHLLQLVVGVLLVLFGLRWLRKAILRAGGLMALHDETAAFAKATGRLTEQQHQRRASYLAGLAAYKAVLLEGVEVVFIVIAVGAGHQMTGYAALGAFAAFIGVMVIGLVVHKPLASVPENTLKLVVGLLLSSFGIFWSGEGLGVSWPGADWSILGVLLVLGWFSLATIRWLRGGVVATQGEM